MGWLQTQRFSGNCPYHVDFSLVLVFCLPFFSIFFIPFFLLSLPFFLPFFFLLPVPFNTVGTVQLLDHRDPDTFSYRVSLDEVIRRERDKRNGSMYNGEGGKGGQEEEWGENQGREGKGKMQRRKQVRGWRDREHGVKKRQKGKKEGRRNRQREHRFWSSL